MKQTVGMIGLGRMGSAIATRLAQAGHHVVGYDPAVTYQEKDITVASSLEEVAQQVRIFWLMVPAGQVVDKVLAELRPLMRKQDIIIDGGNSFFKDSIRRHDLLAQQEIYFLDCGTSGGIHGLHEGFSLMIGGDLKIYEQLKPLWQAAAATDGYDWVGPAGAGHYVKMVHNGIEYALLQAYAEGFHLLRAGYYKNLDLAAITRIWNHGSVIRSWILELAQQIFTQDQALEQVSGTVEESGTGKWTVEEAHERNVPVPVIEKALSLRAWSRETGGNYATKVVSLLRNKFGGHAVQYLKKEREKL